MGEKQERWSHVLAHVRKQSRRLASSHTQASCRTLIVGPFGLDLDAAAA